MSNKLPPSKFGAGTTYGETGQAYALPEPPPPPPVPPPPSAPASPPHPAVTDPYTTNAYQAPPAPDPYPATAYPMPPPIPQPAMPAAAPAAYSAPGSGPGTAIAAATLGLVGALWYGIDVIRSWEAVVALFSSVDQLSNLGLDASATAWAYGSVVSVVAQLILVPALLIGGLLLLCRVPAGRAMVMLGSVLVIAGNIFWALAAFQSMGWMTNFATSSGAGGAASGEFVARVLVVTGLPTLLAVVTLIFASTTSARLWCQRPTSTTY